MTSKRETITYKGRSISILVFTSVQLLVGAIHALLGVLLIEFGASILQTSEAYNVYTLVFGLLVMVFTVFIWQGKKAGWIGTVAVSILVIVADALTLLNLPSIPGIPKFAAPTEIVYSLVVMIYLFQKSVRRKFALTSFFEFASSNRGRRFRLLRILFLRQSSVLRTPRCQVKRVGHRFPLLA